MALTVLFACDNPQATVSDANFGPPNVTTVRDASPSVDATVRDAMVDASPAKDAAVDAMGDAGLVCDLPCTSKQFCRFTEVQCVQAPCPLQPVCRDKVEDCSACTATEDCVIYDAFDIASWMACEPK